MSLNATGLTETWGQVCIDGKLIPAGEACVSTFERGLLYGDGIYETLRVYGGVPFMLDTHLHRMARGCRVIELTPPDTGKIAEGVRKVLEANNLSDAYLRITVTRGATGRLWFDLEPANPTLLIIAKALTPPDFGDGLRLIVSESRTDEMSPLSGIKHIGILPKILARAGARRSGADDAVMLNTHGYVAEATSSNAFWVRGNRLFAPSLSCGILAGITRRIIMDIAADRGIDVVEGEFPLDDLNSAEEMFLTSSTWEIAPVRSLDGQEFASPGPVTRQLAELYKRIIPAQQKTDKPHKL